MNTQLERILPLVQKPARYTGGEYRQVVKDKAQVDVRVAFCFPDTYEIGMSNIGMRILYGIMNELPWAWCERVFAPWGDMEDQMRSHDIPLWALESGDPVRDFDLIAFSVGYEMSYSNILNMLRLAGLPLRSCDRHGLENLVFAGGTCMYNPEPLAPFLDFCSLGEGEDLTVEILELYRTAKAEGWSKERFLREIAQLPGVYVPSLYEHRYNPDGTLSEIVPLDGAPKTVTKRIVQNLDNAYYPTRGIVPSTEIVHDRINLEIFRGCIRACRFCQAGYCYRPVRSKSPEVLLRQARELVEDSGMNEITLSSLSTSDYKRLPELADGLLDYCTPRNINLSLPSLRADNFSDELMQKVQKVRKSGLTFAPEAGTQRLRDAINKNVTEEEILRSCTTAFAGGWSSVKLYFMLGLPTETEEDVLAIPELVQKVWECWRDNTPNRARGVRIHVSTAFFVPKPFTPFQWESQLDPEEYRRRVQLLRDAFRRSKSVVYDYHAPDLSRLEAILARGDRRIASVLERAVELGVKLDGWDEYFDYSKWLQAFADCGVDLDFYTTRPRSTGEILPWDSISVGVRKDYLASEREQAYRSRITPDCRTRCTGCGANTLYTEGPCDD